MLWRPLTRGLADPRTTGIRRGRFWSVQSAAFPVRKPRLLDELQGWPLLEGSRHTAPFEEDDAKSFGGRLC